MHGNPRVIEELERLVSNGLAEARAGLALAIGLRRDLARLPVLESMLDKSDTPETVQDQATWSIGELSRKDPGLLKRRLESMVLNPRGHRRALAWLGIAKSGVPIGSEHLEEAFGIATTFNERLIVAIAAGIAGHPQLLAEGIRGTQRNHAPTWMLDAHIQKDLHEVLRNQSGDGGRALLALMDVGDYFF